MKNWKQLFKFNTAPMKNLLLITGLLLLNLSVLGKANHEKTRTITKEVAVNSQSILNVEHDRGLIEVVYYNGSQAKIEVEIIARGDVASDLQTVVDQYTLKVNTSGKTTKIKSSTNITQWTTQSGGVFSSGKYRIKFKDGTEITSRVSEIKA